MSQILLLTKNTLNEQAFEEKLRRLGHEVFSSEMQIDICLIGKANSGFLKMFTHVIFSESITNNEVKELAAKLKYHAVKILRKSDEKLDESQKQDWFDQGIDDWINNQVPFEVLREKLNEDEIIREGKVVLLPKTEERRSISSLVLSGGELKLLMLLYQQGEQMLSRDELCLRMWNRSKSNSCMSQLSVMVKNLKGKLAAQNIEGPIITTCWGQGYKLHESVYNQIQVETDDLKYVND